MNRKIAIIFIFMVFGGFSIQAQKFTVEVSVDTILMGHSFSVNFTLENIQGEFEAPKFNHFYSIGGVSQSSSISIVNGKMSQTQVYTYRLEPKEEGLFVIEPAFLHTADDVILTDPVQIVVLPNPNGSPDTNGRRQRPSYERDIQPSPTPKTKRPITKL